MMDCVFCKHGTLQPGHITVTLEREQTTVIIKNVPADVCENCGEYFLSEEITEELLARAETAIKNGSELEILRYAA